VQFCVITSVPEAPDVGNLALDVQVYLQDEGNGYKAFSDPDLLGPGVLMLRTPVFVAGEILILDDSGREVAGKGRKPDKWGVKFEYFDDIHSAIRRAQEVG
jgi:hypothetical protein